MSDATSAFSYLSDVHDFRKIIGDSAYEYRTGVEFTPQELYMLIGMGKSSTSSHYRFMNKKFTRSKYIAQKWLGTPYRPHISYCDRSFLDTI